MGGIFTNQTTESRAMWFTSMASAFRMAMACTIVACTTMYGPKSFRHLVNFPSFSYFTIMLTVTDAALGDTIRGCCFAVFALVQSLGPAILVFWVVGPTKISYGTISLTVAMAAMVVMLPKSTHLVAKRLALGQIVVVYMMGFGGDVDQTSKRVIISIQVAASTAAGALASFLATLLPYPRLASLEVRKVRKIMGENAAARLNLFAKAIVADDDAMALESISKASNLSSSAAKLIPILNRNQESMQWERLLFKVCKQSSCWLSCGGGDQIRVQDLELPLRGMNLALSNIPIIFPVEMAQNQQQRLNFENCINGLNQNITFLLNLTPYDSSLTFPEPNTDDIIKALRSIQIMPTNFQTLPPLFFIFCMKLLRMKCQTSDQTKTQENPDLGNGENLETCTVNRTWSLSLVWSDWRTSQVTSRSLMPAFKCGLSMGLAAFLGLLYSKESGFWAGLAVAIGFASGREATFNVANVKTQGTALGSAYGVLVFVVFHRFLLMRLLFLIPWFFFITFLRLSKMYGPAGGISAVVGAVLILGRKDYGLPSEFAINRIIETFIGLASWIMVYILLQPTRASKLVKTQLTSSLLSLETCINSLSSIRSTRAVELEAKHRAFKMENDEFKKLIEEAEIEPNFWFMPIHSNCYKKLLKSLSKMSDFISFSAYAVKNLEQNSTIMEDSWEKLEEKVEKIQEMMGNCINYYIDLCSGKSLLILEKVAEKQHEISIDHEMGKSQITERKTFSDHIDEMETEKLIHSFLQNSSEAIDHIIEENGREEGKSITVLNLSAVAFCLRGLMMETRQIGQTIRELIQWENPSSTTHVDLNEISCNLHVL